MSIVVCENRTNIQLFNLAAAEVLATLYDNFPSPISLKAFDIGDLIKGYFLSDDNTDTNANERVDQISSDTIKWLIKSGYRPIKKLINEVSYAKEQEYVFTAKSFKYDSLYQGKIGNKIKISFREFKDNRARPAFTQNVDYELNKSEPTIIGFKGLRIEVVEATNMSIKYNVIHDYK